ncbi:MAG: efflux RND transporter periplasmic adaptor subunit [Deltaproteobacteria bacterium]|nr:efflux RND transporter periplasmic adaptor subunit [Deltaproteobacteria bacterium]
MSNARKRMMQVIIVLALVAFGVAGFMILTASKAKLEKREPAAVIPFVRAMTVKTGPETVFIRGEGTVTPLREIGLVPQVGGKVVYVSPALVNGGEFRKGDALLRIEPVDYTLAVTLAQAKVKDAESKLQLAEEESEAASEEWRTLHPEAAKGKGNPPPLVAKEPQLAAARASLEAAHADLKKASLNLERTRLTAPFHGRVSQESVDPGQYVTPGQSLATIYSTEAAEIAVPLDQEDLLWIHVPGFTPGNAPGSPAIVSARIGGRELPRSGKVVRTEGKLDERTRMIKVVVRVEKPYKKRPPLAAGLFVTVDIEGRTLKNAALVPRAALHPDDVVWVVDREGRLVFRRVGIARRQGDNVLIISGLKEGERVVTSPMKAVTNGMKVRIAEGNRS